MSTDAIDLGSIQRVLVIKLRHHGDVLLTSPVFTVLKNHAPHLEIDALVYAETAPMLTLHPALSQLHVIDKAWKTQGILARLGAERGLLATLRRRRYDLVVALTPHPRAAWITRLTGARYGVAQVQRGRGRFWGKSFTHFYVAPKGNSRHTAEFHLDALRRLGLQPDEADKRLVLVPGAEAERSVEGRLAAHALPSKSFVHVHPTSRWRFKCWPPDKVAALIDRLQAEGLKVVVTAGPAEEELRMVRDIAARTRSPFVDLSGQLSLKELAAVSAQARLFIGVDSAPMHIAAAQQTPTVAIFGPSGEHEWGPWQVPHQIVTSRHACRPCGRDGCGGGKISECLTQLPVEHVFAAAQALLAHPAAMPVRPDLLEEPPCAPPSASH
ncbi:MAG: putative lipopolysaccharide heptosyltransferase III [Betaproteobacteria bacterium]|nr:putative lipopolysaccharide heptosyltransferase III [Betaproteobacteria bacterium]